MSREMDRTWRGSDGGIPGGQGQGQGDHMMHSREVSGAILTRDDAAASHASAPGPEEGVMRIFGKDHNLDLIGLVRDTKAVELCQKGEGGGEWCLP